MRKVLCAILVFALLLSVFSAPAVSCDFDDDGATDASDAVYLLYHVFFSAMYPLAV